MLVNWGKVYQGEEEKKKVNEIIAENVRHLHLEMMNDSVAIVNVDNALIYVSARRGKLKITVVDRGRLTIRETP